MAQAALPATAAAVLALWAASWHELDAVAAVALGAIAAAAAAVAAWLAARPCECLLRWDGASWSVEGQACRVDLMIDLGAWLLVRARTADGLARADVSRRTRWLAVTAREAGAAWHGLRAALYSRPPAGDRATTGAAVAEPRDP